MKVYIEPNFISFSVFEPMPHKSSSLMNTEQVIKTKQMRKYDVFPVGHESQSDLDPHELEATAWHVYEELYRNFQCQYCSYKAARKSDLTKHIQFNHMSIDKSRQLKQWDETSMLTAVKTYMLQKQSGQDVSMKTIAKQFSVPTSTLCRRIIAERNQTNYPDLTE